MQTFDLNSLLANATVHGQTLVPVEVDWKNEAGEDTKYQIFVVDSVTFAASERIHLGDPQWPDTTRNARFLAERVRLSADGSQRLTPAQVESLNPALGWALLLAVSEYDKSKAKGEAETPETEEAKA